MTTPIRKHDGRRAPIRQEAIRDAIKRLGTFTPATLAAELDCTARTIQNHLPWFIDRGIVERPARGVYAYVPVGTGIDAAAALDLARRQALADDEARRLRLMAERLSTPRRARRGARRATRREVRDLLAQVEAAGGTVRDAKHGYLVEGPNGIAGVPGTASDHRSMKNTIAQVRRDAGLDV